MVEPKDNIAVIVEVGASDRDGFVCVLGEDGEGAGGIEGHTADGGRVDIVLIEDALD